MSKLFVVGIGPGGLNHMTFEAREAIENADVIVGYKTYLDFIEPLIREKEIVSSGMMREVERCSEALAVAATGKTVALISSGDAGIYGMAGLTLELAEPKTEGAAAPFEGVEVVVVPGVSAVQAAASVLGAPLMHDFAVISLSDLMTPLDTIRRRLRAAAEADFVVALYNPRSKGRVTQIEEAVEILIAARGTDVPVGIVRNACRDGEERIVTTLGEMLSHPIDMFSIVIIGNASTRFSSDGRIITPRGYATRGRRPISELTDCVHASTGSARTDLETPTNQHPFTLSPSKGLDDLAAEVRGRNAAPTQGEGDNPGSGSIGAVSTAEARGRNATPTGGADGLRGRDAAPTDGVDGLSGKDAAPTGGVVMFCGTGSDVGKSVLAAGFCRILRNRGVSVAPFKSQNMALNSAVTPEGGEIGRAQGVQAEACGILPHTDMNPVLLKPNSDTGSQVIVQGRVVRNMGVKEYNAYKPEAFLKVRESFERLKSRYSFIVMEGAGSIAEINLRAHDIANLKAAAMAGAPVILIADIDRGGVFAQIVGTIELLTPEEKALVKGVIINKFRGDASLLKSGIDLVEERTGVPVLGVLPWFSAASLPEEDSVALQKKSRTTASADGDKLKVGVLRLPRISNYTDFDALEAEPDVALSYVESPQMIDSLDLLILPGTKSTLADLIHLRETGLSDAIANFKGPIVGICGGYQMLGKMVLDPQRVESSVPEVAGLALLDVVTTMLEEKQTHRVEAALQSAALELAPGCDAAITGYEIHMGETVHGSGARPFATIATRSGGEADVVDGAISADGRVFGTYLHGIFDNHGFRTAFLNRIRRGKGIPEQAELVAAIDPFNALAAHMEQHLDMERIFRICGLAAAAV